MRRVATWLVVCFTFAFGAKVEAADFSFQGYADFRLVVPGSEIGWINGGLGKLRFGGAQPDPNFRFAEAVGQGTLSLSEELRIVAVGRLEPEQRTGIDFLEVYGAWRPHFAGWLTALKVGAFFAPFALENSDLGWTSPYTLTPSAINSWIGDELRTIGAEARVERQTSAGTLSLTAALLCCNDPAGVLIADRGWVLDDRPTGLIEEVREPDASIVLFGGTPPERTPLFLDIDHRIGWYTGASWSMSGIGKVALYRYDNEADPAAHQDEYYAWRTAFWSLGWESHLDSLSILAQGMTGYTVIAPAPGFRATTKFKSAYLLASYDLDDWRFAARAEAFQTRASSGGAMLDEDGHAFTIASSWLPKTWLRLTGELIAITNRRGERILEGLDAQQSDTQFQISARFLD